MPTRPGAFAVQYVHDGRIRGHPQCALAAAGSNPCYRLRNVRTGMTQPRWQPQKTRLAGNAAVIDTVMAVIDGADPAERVR